MTELAEILGPSLELANHKMDVAAALQLRYGNTNNQFHVMNYGAVADGTTDDTAAYLAACAAAVTAGGCARVVFPENKPVRIRQGKVFSTSTHVAGLHSVMLVGAGQNESIIIWDPLDDADYLVRWFTSGDYYAGGGAERLLVKCMSPSATGPVFHVTDGYMTRFNDVAIFGYGSSGGTGILVDNGGVTAQHVVLNNVMIQGLDVGLDVDAVQAMSAYELKLNQNLINGIFRGGTLAWFGGLLQGGGAVFEFRPTAVSSVNFRAYGLYCEVTGPANTFKAYAATTGFGFGGFIKVCDCTNNGTHMFMDVDSYDVHLEDIGGAVTIPVLKAIDASLIGINLTPDPAMFDLDADTQTRTVFFNPGNLSVGTAAPTHPDITHKSANFGLPIQLASFTPAQRAALSNVVENDHVYNNVAKVPQYYTGTKWRSYREPNPADLLGATLLAEWDARIGVGSNIWTDSVTGRVLTGTGSPTFGVDAGKFGGRNVWKFVAASSQSMDTGASGATIFSAGVGAYYISFVARQTSGTTTGTHQGYVNMLDNANTTIGMQFSRTDTSVWNSYQLGGFAHSGGSTPDTAQHLFEIFLDGTGKRYYAIDGVDVGDGLGGNTTAVIVERIMIGAYVTASWFSNLAVARVRVCTTVPSAALRTALLEVDRDVWNF